MEGGACESAAGAPAVATAVALAAGEASPLLDTSSGAMRAGGAVLERSTVVGGEREAEVAQGR
jgi:hypothetical protein